MKTIIVFLTSILLSGMNSSQAQQAVSDEAKRHFDRGMAAVEMAKSAGDYGNAIEEFEQSATLAPDWPDIYYNLGMIQEKAEKYNDAITNLRQYLLLAPNAGDAETVKSLINKLEYKAEQVLTVPDIIEVLVSFGRWQEEGDCSKFPIPFAFEPEGHDAVRVLKDYRFYAPMTYQTLKVKGPVLKYSTTRNVAGSVAIIEQLINEGSGDITAVMEDEVEVVSKKLAKVNRKTLRGGIGNGVATGQILSCTFEKK